jgi:hypothetical protein
MTEVNEWGMRNAEKEFVGCLNLIVLTTDFSRSFTEYIEEWIRFLQGLFRTRIDTDENG